MVIAVDGPAASGKGTLSERIAEHFGLAYLDTGQLYRAVAAKMLAAGANPEDVDLAAGAALSLVAEDLERDDLRGPTVSETASIVAAQPAVRAALLAFQREFAAHPPALDNGEAARGAVLDGRDIGTVICPNADAKLFVTALAGTRAERRWLQRRNSGDNISLQRVLEDIRIRDERDMSRKEAPLRPPRDALLLDTTNLGIEAAIARAIALISDELAGRLQPPGR